MAALRSKWSDGRADGRIFSQCFMKVLLSQLYSDVLKYSSFYIDVYVFIHKVAYYGRGDEVVDYFSALDIYCAPHYNPADFISKCTLYKIPKYVFN